MAFHSAHLAEGVGTPPMLALGAARSPRRTSHGHRMAYGSAKNVMFHSVVRR
jgi:hypothetical protein